jgi:pyrroloquinoline quinone biosynthesis protein E
VQDAEAVLSDSMAGRKAFAAKQQAADAAREAGLPLSMNVVLHRLNLERVEEIIDLCLSWGAERLELANAQYYGWALVNLERLLPSREQLKKAEAVYQRKKASLRGKMELIWVRSDYYEPFPKPCMGGWGRIHLTVSPDGFVLPCPVAKTIKTLRFDSVQERSLSWIWYQSPAFNRFRGWDWMPEPCRSCSRRFEDFGGCRCQAFALAGDAAKTDPVCQWAPDHALVRAAVARGSEAHRANPSKTRESKETFRGLVYRHLRAS